MAWFRMMLLAVAAGLLVHTPAPACPFCSMQGQTLSKEAALADFVVFGTPANPRLAISADGVEDGFTDLIIDEKDGIIKPHDILKGKKVIVLPRYLPVEKDSKVRLLVFCEVFNDRIDPYRGMPVRSSDIVTYLKGALAN